MYREKNLVVRSKEPALKDPICFDRHIPSAAVKGGRRRLLGWPFPLPSGGSVVLRWPEDPIDSDHKSSQLEAKDRRPIGVDMLEWPNLGVSNQGVSRMSTNRN